MVDNNHEEKGIRPREVWPHLTEEQANEAAENLKWYLEVVVRIYDRLKAEGRSWPPPLSEDELAELGRGTLLI